MYIPLTKPFWGKKEEKAAIEALRNSSGAGDGPYTKKLTLAVQKLTGSKFVIPVTSCTHGLELAVIAMKMAGRLNSGDEVIVPSFTMTSTANAILLSGAIPVFADIEDTYYCIDPADIAKKITKKTRGIIVVHYAGMSCNMKKILDLAKSHNLFVIEDAAHAIGATYNNKMLGTFGDVGVYSFHGTKNISCGEGGVVLTNDKKLADFMEIYRANGTNRAAFLAGIVDKYSWVALGTSYFLSDILASITFTQIGQIGYINKKRNQIASFYTKALAPYKKFFKLPQVPKGGTPNWHIYAIVFYKKQDRDIFLTQMRAKGIDVAYHYVPLHSSKMGKSLGRVAQVAEPSDAYRGAYFAAHPSNRLEERVTRVGGPPRRGPLVGVLGGKPEAGPAGSSMRMTVLENRHRAASYDNLPVTDRVWQTLIRLPIYPGLSKKELDYIVSSAREVLEALQ